MHFFGINGQRSLSLRESRALCTVVVLVFATGQLATGQESFSKELLLVGTKTTDAPREFTIRTMSSAGELGKPLYRMKDSTIVSARFSPTRDRLAVGATSQGTSRVFFVDSKGAATEGVDAGPHLCNWSPDASLIAFTRGLESFQLTVKTGEVLPIELPQDYLIDDWHPTKNLRTTIFLNPRNSIYREFRGDRYPTRQIDLLAIDDKLTPITKNPSSDNIWSRFSPDGSRIAHYQRVLHHEVPHETLVVCDADGANAATLLDLRKIGTSIRLPWYRPRREPVWSPDGKTIAWLVNTNRILSSEDEQIEVLFVDVDSRKFHRVPLKEKGIDWVSGLEW